MVEKKDYIKWYSLARSIVNDDVLIPQRSDEEIKKLVSDIGWFMFAPKGLSDKVMAREDIRPNIYMLITSKKQAILGLAFDKVPTIDHFHNIVEEYSHVELDELLKKLKPLPDYWKTTIQIKTKEGHHQVSPHYKDINTFKTNTLDRDKLISISNQLQEIREDNRNKFRKSPYRCITPVMNLMENKFILAEGGFSERVKPIFEVLKICRNIKTRYEVGIERKRRTATDDDIVW